VFVPGGLVGLITRTRNRVTAWAAEGEPAGEETAVADETPAPVPRGDPR